MPVIGIYSIMKKSIEEKNNIKRLPEDKWFTNDKRLNWLALIQKYFKMITISWIQVFKISSYAYVQHTFTIFDSVNHDWMCIL